MLRDTIKTLVSDLDDLWEEADAQEDVGPELADEVKILAESYADGLKDLLRKLPSS